MLTITRVLEFDYGHRIMQHEGKCAHLHGHRGKIEIEVTAEQLDFAGRVIDFGAVKSLVGGWIDGVLDHAMLLQAGDPTIEFVEKHEMRHLVLSEPPTAENLAVLLFETASRFLNDIHGLRVIGVTFWETPNSKATFRP